MEVIGAGFGRTGTASLKIALEQLGLGPCYHMSEVFTRPADAGLWHRAGRGEPVDWDALLDGYRSAVDWPAAAFYRELAARYPEAKVLLTVRDPQRWYDSAARTIFRTGGQSSRGWTGRLLRLFSPPRMRRFFAMIDEVIWRGTFDGRFPDREHAIAVFNRHNATVQQEFPAERLLVYDVAEGWEPLCAFLGVPAPDTPFPHVNTADEFLQRTRRVRVFALAPPVLAASVLALGILFVVRQRRSAA